MGHSRPLFLYFRLFYKQLTVNKCSIKVADDWIRTRILWYWKRPLCQLRHNHCPRDFLECKNLIQETESNTRGGVCEGGNQKTISTNQFKLTIFNFAQSKSIILRQQQKDIPNVILGSHSC